MNDNSKIVTYWKLENNRQPIPIAIERHGQINNSGVRHYDLDNRLCFSSHG